MTDTQKTKTGCYHPPDQQCEKCSPIPDAEPLPPGVTVAHVTGAPRRFTSPGFTIPIDEAKPAPCPHHVEALTCDMCKPSPLLGMTRAAMDEEPDDAAGYDTAADFASMNKGQLVAELLRYQKALDDARDEGSENGLRFAHEQLDRTRGERESYKLKHAAAETRVASLETQVAAMERALGKANKAIGHLTDGTFIQGARSWISLRFLD